MPTIAGINITKAAHDNIVKAVLDRAEEQGYCSEVEDFLEDLGFTIPNQTATVTIEVTVSGFGRNKNVLSENHWSVYPTEGDTDSVRVVSVK